MRKHILRILSIRESESRVISRLFLFEFFQGAGIATYFFAAISLFVHRLPASELPKVFILSSFLLWLFGYLFHHLEHRLLTKHLIYFVLIFNAVLIGLFRIFFHLHEEGWFLYFFLASFNILYLLNNLEFWGLVALLFDVRQSKRLFAIVSAWDGPARMAGYAIAGLFATINHHDDVVTTQSLLVIALLSMLIALVLYIPMARSREMANIAPAEHHHYATQTLEHIQASLTGNQLIRNAALVSFFAFCFYLITNFVLYAYLKKQMKTDSSLYLFFTVFFLLSRGLTLVIKPMFVNRLLDNIGLKKSLLVAPISLFVLAGLSILSGHQSPRSIFYLYLVMAISIDILRTAIQSPVLLATLQPLPTQQRLRGHTIIKGLMDPFAFLASGLLLLFFAPPSGEINLPLLSVVLLFIAAVWIYFAFSIDRIYIRMLTKAIRKRFLHSRDISITDANSLNFMLSRIEKGGEEEVIAVLNVISSQPVNREKFYSGALRHGSPRIREIALRYIQSQQCASLLPELKKMLVNETDPLMLPHLVRTVAALDRQEDLSHFFEHENEEVANAALMAWLMQEDGAQKKEAETHLSRLFESREPGSIVKALQMVGELKLHKFADQVLILIGHPDAVVQWHAVHSAGKLANEKLLGQLLRMYMHEQDDKHILDALQTAGEKAAPLVGTALWGNYKPDAGKRKKLYILLGKIGGRQAEDVLERSLTYDPEGESAILSALYLQHFTCPPDKAPFKDLLSRSMAQGASLAFTLEFLHRQREEYPLLVGAVELELAALKTKCLWLFSFMYGSEQIRRARAGFEAGTRESVANAFELIEMTVPKEQASAFIALFEKAEARTAGALRKIFRDPLVSLHSFLGSVLAGQPGQFSDWTRAVLLYCFRDRPELLAGEWIAPYAGSGNPMLREIAEYINERKPLH